MGILNLPTGNFELNLKPNKAGAKYNGWESVMITDGLYASEIASAVEEWTESGYEVLAARYNGKAVSIPANYHWEVRCNGEAVGRYARRSEARAVIEDRKRENRAIKDKGKRKPVGGIYFVQE